MERADRGPVARDGGRAARDSGSKGLYTGKSVQDAPGPPELEGTVHVILAPVPVVRVRPHVRPVEESSGHASVALPRGLREHPAPAPPGTLAEGRSGPSRGPRRDVRRVRRRARYRLPTRVDRAAVHRPRRCRAGGARRRGHGLPARPADTLPRPSATAARHRNPRGRAGPGSWGPHLAGEGCGGFAGDVLAHATRLCTQRPRSPANRARPRPICGNPAPGPGRPEPPGFGTGRRRGRARPGRRPRTAVQPDRMIFRWAVAPGLRSTGR